MKRHQIALTRQFWLCRTLLFPRLFLFQFLSKLNDSNVPIKLRTSSFRQGLLAFQNSQPFESYGMEKPTGADWNSFGHPNSLSPFDALAMNLSLNAFVTFNVHSQMIPKVSMAGTKVHSMIGKTDQPNRVKLCPTGQIV